MAEKFKSKKEVMKLAFALKARRRALGLTIKDIEKSQKINCGQISRFESGGFRTNSNNLQKLCKFLQIKERGNVLSESAIGLRLENFAALSPRHRVAAEEILDALERISKVSAD